MAPQYPVRDEWPDAPLDRDEFFRDLQQFYEERGLPIDTHAKVNGKPIDLFLLFQNVEQRGGYDRVSAEKLLWRKVALEFNIGQTNVAAYAFALKSTYYKNLSCVDGDTVMVMFKHLTCNSAYAIKRVHKQEPPPKEILELITAKGADLLHRTVDNFQPSPTQQATSNGRQSDDTDEETQNTPKTERPETEEAAGSGTRARSRGSANCSAEGRADAALGLRQAPPQRVFFQPDTNPARQSRGMNRTQSPQPPSQGMVNGTLPVPPDVVDARPQTGMPLALRSVATPASNPAGFREKVRRVRELELAKYGQAARSRTAMVPGTGFEGPNIYVRTLNALRSGVPAEQDYALHHLVKISHERFDKFKFEAFPGLADGLIEKAMQISEICYGMTWRISYMDDAASTSGNILDGLNGTPDLLDRIRKLPVRRSSDTLQPQESSMRLNKCTEACLVLRNMSLLEENARYLAVQKPFRDLLVILLNLPPEPELTEIHMYALEMAEQTTRFWVLDISDPLYISLLQILSSTSDRAALLASLRAITRTSLYLEEPNALRNVPSSTIQNIFNWLLLDDEELLGACLDFFYEFTTVPENVSRLLTMTEQEGLPLGEHIQHLCSLLSFQAIEERIPYLVAAAAPSKAAPDIPEMPKDLLDQILPVAEPERSSKWLRSTFSEDPQSDVTQIALWQAYQARLLPHATSAQPLLSAADFIKNVSTTFAGATAQVINDGTGPPRFIIKGIKPRFQPLDLAGESYLRCLWIAPGMQRACGAFYKKAADLYDHIVVEHVGVTRNSDKRWDLAGARANASKHNHRFNCYWARCPHFAATGGTDDPLVLGMHVKTHLPSDREDTREGSGGSENSSSAVRCPRPTTEAERDEFDTSDYPAELSHHYFHNTSVDERGAPTGIALTSALILRNLARNIPRAVRDFDRGGRRNEDWSGQRWLETLFLPSKTMLLWTFAHNKALFSQLFDLVQAVVRKSDLPTLV